MNNNPLVSVVVITYNSAKTVIETLDSIAAQTYKNIELIISDDCSKDETVKVCEDWLKENRERFVRTELLTVEKNTGIAGNANRANQAANGIWIKTIAGDDILLTECVHQNVKYVIEHSDARIVFSKVIPFGSTQYVKEFSGSIKKSYAYFMLNNRDFLFLLLLNNFILAPSAFMQKSLFLELGGYDESIPLIEDWPFWIKVSLHKIRFHFLSLETVKYRMQESSISRGHTSIYSKSEKLALQYVREVQNKTNKLLWFYGLCDVNQVSSDSTFIRTLSIFGKIVNPISYYIRYLKYKVSKVTVR